MSELKAHQADALRVLRSNIVYELNMDKYAVDESLVQALPYEVKTAFDRHMTLVRAVQAIDVVTEHQPDSNEYDGLRHCAVWAIEKLGDKESADLIRNEAFLDTAKVVGVYRR